MSVLTHAREGARRYRSLLALPGARAPVILSAAGSMPIGMFGLGILLLAHDATGSFAVAGRVVGAFSLANALGAVAQGRLMDRLGQTRVLRAAALGHVPALAALVIAADEQRADLGAGALRAVRRGDVPAGPRRDALGVGCAGGGRRPARDRVRDGLDRLRGRGGHRARAGRRDRRGQLAAGRRPRRRRARGRRVRGVHPDVGVAALARRAPRGRLAGPARRAGDAHRVRRPRGLRHGGRDRAGRRAGVRRAARLGGGAAGCCWRRCRRAA